MRSEFWHDRWHRGQTGFHRTHVDAYLVNHWAVLDAPTHGAVFVPLCGKSLDLLWLREQGHEVLGVELSDIAVQAFFMENAFPARRRRMKNFDRYEASRIALLRGDFFDLEPALVPNVTAVFDRAALVSWTPELRRPYVDRMTALTSIGTPTLLITVEYAQEEMSGPPFSVKRDEVERLYALRYEIKELARRDALPEEPRMRAKGVSKLVETCYRLILTQ